MSPDEDFPHLVYVESFVKAYRDFLKKAEEKQGTESPDLPFHEKVTLVRKANESAGRLVKSIDSAPVWKVREYCEFDA